MEAEININKAELAAIGVKLEQYPDDGKPEIAFVGKSNVGKSSLINSLVNRRALARTSSAPGKTRTINFFNIEDRLYFVDLPGYGYAKISKSEQQKWGAMIEEYLLNRNQLKLIILLIDIRHEVGVNDKMMYEWFRYHNIPMLIVATKHDKLKRSAIPKAIKTLREGLGLVDGQIIPFSSLTKFGRESLWKTLNEAVEYDDNNI